MRTGLAMTGYKKCRVKSGAGRPGGRPLRMVTRSTGVIGRRGEGRESSAASGRRSEMSEWPRSKFQVAAARQRGNFGHRNRIIGPYGGVLRGAVVDPSVTAEP